MRGRALRRWGAALGLALLGLALLGAGLLFALFALPAADRAAVTDRVAGLSPFELPLPPLGPAPASPAPVGAADADDPAADPDAEFADAPDGPAPAAAPAAPAPAPETPVAGDPSSSATGDDASALCAAAEVEGGRLVPDPGTAAGRACASCHTKAALATPAGLAVTAGDMTDQVSWSPVSGADAYRIERAPSPGGTWVVAAARVSGTSYTDRMRAARTWYYRVRALDGAGAAGEACAPAANSRLAISVVVPAGGHTIRAANGALTLALPSGAFASPTRVEITEASVPGDGALVSVTPQYSFRAETALRAPATLTIPYRVPVAHFQVAGTVARAIEWYFYDEGSRRWTAVPTTVDTARGTITATMPHFSYWEGAFIQPHGTSPSKTDYCGTVCHNLVVAPGSSLVLSSADSQVCYHCHGNTSAALPAAGATGPNIQAELFQCGGQSAPASSSVHPVRAPGSTTGLKCTSCHDVHRDPTASPKLLRSFDAVTGRAVASVNATTPGNPYCWTCHGTRKNNKIDLLVPGYWTRAGGDKKTAYAQTRHGQLPIETLGTHDVVYSTAYASLTDASGLSATAGSTNVRVDGSGGFVYLGGGNTALGHESMVVTCTQPVVDAPLMFDATSGTAALVGPFPSGTTQITYDITIDMGVSQPVYMAFVDSGPSPARQVTGVAVSTSPDGESWTLRAQRAAPSYQTGTLAQHSLLWAGDPVVRYVRFTITDHYAEADRYSGILHVAVLSPAPVWGRWVSRTIPIPIDTAGELRAGSTTCTFTAVVPSGAGCEVESRVSLDGGATWSAWSAQADGGPIPGLSARPSIENASVQYQAHFSQPIGASRPELHDVSHAIEITVEEPLRSTGSDGCTQCHFGHGSSQLSLSRSAVPALCYGCHPRVGNEYPTSEHGQRMACAECHDFHGRLDGSGMAYERLLVGRQTAVCLGCHDDPANSAHGIDIKERLTYPTEDRTSMTRPLWAMRHNVDENEQAILGNRLRCSNCHGPHSASREAVLVDPLDPTRTLERTIPVPRVLRLPATADADVTSGTVVPNGLATSIRLGDDRRVLVKFDLSAIPADAQMVRAILMPRASWLQPPVPTAIVYPRVGVYQVTQPWDEATVTWTDRGSGLGAWSQPGGDIAGSPIASLPWDVERFDVTSYVETARVGGDNGLLIRAIEPCGAYTWGGPSREAGYVDAAVLEVSYHPAEGPDMGYDSREFCLKCHSGRWPAGVRPGYGRGGGGYANIGALWAGNAHGLRVGAPDAGVTDSMRAPYDYGHEALQCTVCHDPHGSSNVHHLRENVNGGTMGFAQDVRGAYWGSWCGQCHVRGDHLHYSTACGYCHYHNSSNAF